MKGFYFICDDMLSLNGSLSDVQSAVEAGVEAIQYRSKTKTTKLMYEQALQLKQASAGALFIVNDRLDIAQAIDADGVHLGQDDMPCDIARKILGPNKIIGISTHSLEQATQAQKQGADYIGFGPVFATSTKKNANPVGIDLLKKVRKQVMIPIVAIGGIDINNASELLNAGADCVCAISAVVTKNDVAAEIMKFQKLFG
jgi:thiamine-phosphate pyrophosphorylase